MVCFSGWRILHEIRAKARAAEEVQRQRLVLETTLASMGEGVIVADRQGKMTLFNPMAERILGTGLTEQDPSQWPTLYGTFFPDQVTPFPFEQLPLVRAIHGEAVDDVELFIRRPGVDEGTFVSVTGRPLADSTSESGGGVVVFHDITERRRDAQTLREALERTRDLYDHAPCGYHSLDAAGVVVEMNATELRWLGYERAEVVGKMNFAQLITPASLQGFHEEFAAFKARGEVRDLEFTLVRKDGATFPVLLSSSAVTDVQGRYLHSRSVVVDITDRKRAEEALRRLHDELEERVAQRTDELARANRDLTQKNQEVEMFVYSVSHDLRSPLVNLQGFGQELKTLCRELRALLAAGETPEPLRTKGIALIDLDVAEAVAFIQSAVLRLSGIIDSLLRLSRAGRIEYQLQPVDMNAVLQRIVHAQTPTIARTRAEVIVGPLPPAFGDPTAVEQIFANLVANSLNYLSPDRAGRVEVSAATDPGGGRAGVTYCVRDNGLGIPRDFQPKIFQPFQRLHPGQAQGEGIGLMLVRQMVERHGGRIWFESEADAGAAFFVTLPACAVEPAAALPAASPPAAVSLQESST